MRNSCAQAALIVLQAAILLAGSPAWPAPSAGAIAPLGKGWGRLLAVGTLAGISQAAQTVTFAMTPPGSLEVFDGGTVWRRQPLSGAQLVHLLPATLLVDARDERIPVAAMRDGVPAKLWAAVRPDAAILGLKLWVAQPSGHRAGAVQAGFSQTGLSGVILRRYGPMFDLLTSQGNRRSVIVTGATVIRAPAGPIPAAGLGAHDVVGLEGVTNSDGSIVATRIDVEMAAASSARISGRVEQHIAEVDGLIIAGVMVATAADTYVIRGATLIPLERLATGQPVMVYGTPISTGSVSIGLHARVVMTP